jgi:predicted transport protein
MPLFQITDNSLNSISQVDLDSEKRLQGLIERSLGPTFNCRFVSSEFSTGADHAGRIDTLALSEDNNPVIVEYKKVESSDLINQSLFYLSWLRDHRGDFEMAARRAIPNLTVDWSDIRVICLAPNYKKYDLHAVSVMGANIELWRYRLFANSCIYLEQVYGKAIRTAASTTDELTKDPVMVAAGKKAAITRATGSYTVDQHLERKPEHVRELAQSVREFITGLDTAIEEVPKKYYIAYKISQNIACMCVGNKEVTLYLKIDPKGTPPLEIVRDVSDIGHVGTGDTEVTIETEKDFQDAKPLIERAYREVGG